MTMQTHALPPASPAHRPASPARRPRPTLRKRLRPTLRTRTAREPLPSALRRGRVVALSVGCFLLPWCVLLGATLPTTTEVQNWSLAWTGLDAGEAVAALATAWLITREDPRAALTAVAGGALLIADAWFDVCTSAPGADHALAVAEAVFAELPLAGAAFWLALTLTRHGQSRPPKP
jgi:hypothetical protein